MRAGSSRTIEPLRPAVMRPRHLRRLGRIVVLSLLGSSALAIGSLHALRRTHDAPFEEAALRRARIADARTIAKKYAYEGFPAWVVAHPAYACPQRLAELDVFVDRLDTIDPWGTSFQSYCHDGNTFRVVSAGPDRTHGTPDDIIEGS
jgi:hypothetical protein